MRRLMIASFLAALAVAVVLPAPAQDVTIKVQVKSTPNLQRVVAAAPTPPPVILPPPRTAGGCYGRVGGCYGFTAAPVAGSRGYAVGCQGFAVGFAAPFGYARLPDGTYATRTGLPPAPGVFQHRGPIVDYARLALGYDPEPMPPPRSPARRP